MNATGILVPPLSDTTGIPRSELQQQLWDATRERMDRFLPGLLDDVIPSPPPLPSQASNPPATEEGT